MKKLIFLIVLYLVGCAAPIYKPAPMKKEVPIGEMGATVRGHHEEPKEINH